MKAPPQGPGADDITWPGQVAARGRRTPSTRKDKPQTSNLREPSTMDRKLPHSAAGMVS